jgi:putative redox protein
MEAKVKFLDGLQFLGEAGSGHAIVMDGDPKYGGHNTAMRPSELLLVGLGGCAGMDVVSVLKKKRQPFTGLEITVKGTVPDGEPPRRITDAALEFVVKGKGVSEEAVKRAVELSMEKYCTVKFTLEGSTNVGFTYRLEEG